ncbi:MAG: nucleotidyltransferase domain-containing protein [Candidatus Woesearchaeota archaeon]
MQKADVKVIQALLDYNNLRLSIRGLAKILKKDYKNMHNIIMRLANNNIVVLEPFGNAHKVTLVKKPHPYIFEAEHNRREDILRNKTIRAVLSYYNNMSTVFFVLLLFGSYAKRNPTRHSDIDLLFIIPDGLEEIMNKEIMSISSTIPLPLHINVFNETEFKSMSMSKEFTVGSEAINNNIILHGTEYFYEMIR